MDSKHASAVSLGEQLIRGRDRAEKRKKTMLNSIYHALIRGRDKSEDWNFFDLAKAYGLYVEDIAQAPTTLGYYMLFAENGDFIYVGKADNLHQRLVNHFGQGEDGPHEENERINGIAKYAIWMPTQTIAEAEEAEGHLYDTWVRNTGLPPFANKNKPPKSKLRDNETKIAKLRLRQILNELRSLRA